jgi:hypothetical protein
LTGVADGAGIGGVYVTARSNRLGDTMTECHDSAAVADALAAVRDAVDRCRAVLAARADPRSRTCSTPHPRRAS